MLPNRVSNPGPLTYESDALPIALRGPAIVNINISNNSAFLGSGKSRMLYLCLLCNIYEQGKTHPQVS